MMAMALIFFAIFVVALALGGIGFGADSRDGQDWMLHASSHAR